MNRTAINKKANKEIDKYLIANDIRYCELRLPDCFVNNFLQRVHRNKRAWYYGKEDSLLWNPSEFVLGCQRCHDKVEDNEELREDVFNRVRGG